jgi:hypothetical protein
VGLPQDIAVVPFLVLLPLVETNDLTGPGAMSLLQQLGPTAATTLGSLGLLLVGGRFILRGLFEVGCETLSLHVVVGPARGGGGNCHQKNFGRCKTALQLAFHVRHYKLARPWGRQTDRQVGHTIVDSEPDAGVLTLMVPRRGRAGRG